MVYSTTIATSLLTISGLLIVTSSLSQVPKTDSGQSKNQGHGATIKATGRVLSKGMFTYGGRVPCDNPAFDINFICEHNGWGIQLFKVTDLNDHTSSNNFTMVSVYKNLKITKRLTFTPYLATIIEQQYEVVGHDSDIGFIGITAFKLSHHFTIDHTMYFGNQLIHPSSRDWVNRVRIMFTTKHLDVTGFFWHNNPVFDSQDYTSAAATIAYNRIAVSRHFNLNFAATELAMLESSNEEEYPIRSKLVLSAAVQYIR